MNKEEILKEREEWYNFTPTLFEIVKILKNRELCFLSPKEAETKKVTRYLLASSVKFLLMHFEWRNFLKHRINLYHSVSKFKPNSIPIFSYNMQKRTKEEEYLEFNKNYESYVESYNFFIDMDGKENFEECYEETRELKKIFDEYKVPYYMLNSSLKGFHIIIPSEYMPKIPVKETIETISKVIGNIKAIYDFKNLDTSIADLKRVCKCPYSYVCDNSIALPLTDWQFENFNSEMVTMKNVLKRIRIKDRGLLIRTHDLDDEQLKKNVLCFIEEFK